MSVLLALMLMLVRAHATEHRRRRAHAETHEMLHGDHPSDDEMHVVFWPTLHLPEGDGETAESNIDHIAPAVCAPALLQSSTGNLNNITGDDPRSTEQLPRLSDQGSASATPASSSMEGTPIRLQRDPSFSWLTCIGCVVTLTMQQRPSLTPSDSWVLSSLENQVFRALMICSVEATSLQATLDEVHRRLQLEGHTAEHAAALTGTLHRWFVADSLPGEHRHPGSGVRGDNGHSQVGGSTALH